MAITRHSNFDKTVQTIIDRNNISNKVNGMMVVVLDAIADPNAGSGKAIYRWESSDSSWILVSKSTTETMNFVTEELAIVNGEAQLSYIPVDNQVWNGVILNGSLIYADLNIKNITIANGKISGFTPDVNGLILRVTYAYGTISQQITTAIEDSVDAALLNNIKTINGNDIVGTGNIEITAALPEFKTINSESILGTGDIQIVTDISGKADKATTIAGYGITDAYTKTEVESKIVELSPPTDISMKADIAYVDSKITDIINLAPATLDTLGEIATQLTADEGAVATLTSIVNNKVDKITGKGLSTEDFTTAEKTKLAGIESGAQVNVITSVAGKTGDVSLDITDITGLNDSLTNTATDITTIKADVVNATLIDKAFDYFKDGHNIATYLMNGNAKDSLGTHDGIATGISYDNGKFGLAAVSSVDSKIAFGNVHGNATTVVVAGWVKLTNPDSSGSNNMIFGFDKYNLVHYRGGIGFNSYNGDCYGIDATGFLNTWKHIIVEFTQGAYGKIWVDGVEQVLTQRQGVPNYTSCKTAGEGFNIFATGGTTVSGNFGMVDSIRLFDRSLTLSEINSLLNNNEVSTIEDLYTVVDTKVTSEIGKGLSTEDFTTAEKTKLSSIEVNANNYVLPVATSTVLGGVKAGTNISIDANGVISANDSSVSWSEITSKPTTLSGYGITDAYTKTETDSAISTSINNLVNGAPAALDTLKEIATQLTNDESALNALIVTVGTKANSSDVYTKAEIDSKIPNISTLEFNTGMKRGTKIVYGIEVDAGVLTNATTKDISFTFNSSYTYWLDAQNSYASSTSEVLPLPYSAVGIGEAIGVKLDLTNNKIKITSGIDRTSLSAKIVILYTK